MTLQDRCNLARSSGMGPINRLESPVLQVIRELNEMGSMLWTQTDWSRPTTTDQGVGDHHTPEHSLLHIVHARGRRVAVADDAEPTAPAESD